jgi:transcriptional regulator with XRE-family HTH domain
MEHSKGVAQELRAECARQKISGREIARRLGEHPMWVHRRLAGDQELSIDDLARISAVLGLAPADLMTKKSTTNEGKRSA